MRGSQALLMQNTPRHSPVGSWHTRAFGLHVQAPFPVPGTPSCDGRHTAPDTVITLISAAELNRAWRGGDSDVLMDARYVNGRRAVTVEHRHDLGFSISMPRYGRHVISSDGSRISSALPKIAPHRWQRLLFAQPLPLAALLRGRAVFHASAVAFGDQALMFIAPSGTGKTSLAGHLVSRGATLMADDALVLERDRERVLAHPATGLINIDAKELATVAPDLRPRLGEILGHVDNAVLCSAVPERAQPVRQVHLLERGTHVSRFTIERIRRPDARQLLSARFFSYVRRPQVWQEHLKDLRRTSGFSGDLCGRGTTGIHGSSRRRRNRSSLPTNRLTDAPAAMESIHNHGLAGMYAPRSGAISGRALASRLADHRNLTVHMEGELALASFSNVPVLAGTAAGTFSLLVGELHDPGALAARLGSDTQERIPVLVAHAYRRFGETVLEQLSGDFVLVLWDSSRREGCLVQSRTGIHTLYLHATGEQLAFATEFDVLQQMLEVRRAPDDISVLAFIANRPLPEDRTMYAGIRKLGPGQRITISEGRWTRCRYWAPTYSGVSEQSTTELQESIWSLVRQAVRRRVDLDATTAIIMSGGIDSAAVATSAAEVSAGRAQLRSYSGVFPDWPDIDESPRIKALADRTRIPNTRCAVAPEGLLAVCLEYLRAFDVPPSGPGYLLEHVLLEHAAADGATAVLDGQGGDEVFGSSFGVLADLLRAGQLRASFRTVRHLPDGDRASRSDVLAVWRAHALKGLVPHDTQRLIRRFEGPGALHARLAFTQCTGPLGAAHGPVGVEEAERTALVGAPGRLDGRRARAGWPGRVCAAPRRAGGPAGASATLRRRPGGTRAADPPAAQFRLSIREGPDT